MYKILIGCMLLVLPVWASAQTTTTLLLTRKQVRQDRPKYVQLGVGLNFGSVRDFATSPITYSGALFNYSFARLNMDSKRETKLTVRFNNGSYGYSRADGIPTSDRTSVYLLSLNYYRLYRINKWSSDKWNIKAGGMFDVTSDVRINPSFMNAGYGYEVFNTLFLSGKVTRNFERTTTVHKKFLFIKYKLKPRLIQLSYQLNRPAMNGYARNGFAYIGNERINETPLFSEYQYKLFSGFRISSELAYTNRMHNGNMWRVAYLWDAYTTGGDHNRFEMANHIVEFSLLFHLNKNVQP